VKVTVWIDAWQMQCCGDPISLGAPVRWAVMKPDTDWLSAVLGTASASVVDYAEERHSDQSAMEAVEGIVRSIRTVHYRTAAQPATPTVHYPVPGTAQTSEVSSADGWEQPVDQLEFGGYLVDLDVLAMTEPPN
jgi:hypothetical protein